MGLFDKFRKRDGEKNELEKANSEVAYQENRSLVYMANVMLMEKS